VAVSPNTPSEEADAPGEHAAVSCEVALQWPLRHAIATSVGLGRYTLSGRDGGAYWYWSTGLAYDLQPWRFEAGYFGASRAAWGLFDAGIPHSHWAATLLWRF
jgi:hypothetical protein